MAGRDTAPKNPLQQDFRHYITPSAMIKPRNPTGTHIIDIIVGLQKKEINDTKKHKKPVR